MKKWEKLAYLKEIDFDLYYETLKQVRKELSYGQPIICCCGRLATGLHEAHCSKFKNKVEAEVIKRLKHLLPSKH